ncbi:MAG: hypothetical protein IPO21_10770 [Bacteroidales bacterium]|nr:hypothetical protein [Bacteroidales bacterium]
MFNNIFIEKPKVGEQRIVKQSEDYIYSSATNYAELDSLLQVELLNTKWKTFS